MRPCKSCDYIFFYFINFESKVNVSKFTLYLNKFEEEKKLNTLYKLYNDVPIDLHCRFYSQTSNDI